MKKAPKLVKHSEILEKAARVSDKSLEPMVKFSNWAIVFRLEQAAKPSPQEQFAKLFKGDIQ